MTGPRGNSEFYVHDTLNVAQDEANWNIEVEGEKYSLFPMGPLMFVKQRKITKNDI